MINEELAEEMERGEERKERNSRDRTAASAPKRAASASHESRDSSVELDPNLRNSLHMKSASSAACGSGQQFVKRSAADAEPEAHTGVPKVMSTD